MAINVIVQYNGGFLPEISLLTQAPVFVWFDDTTIIVYYYYICHTLLTMYCSVFCFAQLIQVYNITWASSRHYTVDPMLLPTGNPFEYHVVALFLQPTK